MWEHMTGLSRLHSQGSLYASGPALARETGYLLRDVHTTMADLEGEGWVTRRGLDSWRLVDGTVQLLPNLKKCEPCLRLDDMEARALADISTPKHRWMTVCAKHYVEHGRGLGAGIGQFLRLDY